MRGAVRAQQLIHWVLLRTDCSLCFRVPRYREYRVLVGGQAGFAYDVAFQYQRPNEVAAVGTSHVEALFGSTLLLGQQLGAKLGGRFGPLNRGRKAAGAG